MRAFLTSPRSSLSNWPSPRWPSPVSVPRSLPISTRFVRLKEMWPLPFWIHPNWPSWRAQGDWARPTFYRYPDSDQSYQDRGEEIVFPNCHSLRDLRPYLIFVTNMEKFQIELKNQTFWRKNTSRWRRRSFIFCESVWFLSSWCLFFGQVWWTPQDNDWLFKIIHEAWKRGLNLSQNRQWASFRVFWFKQCLISRLSQAKRLI